MEYGFWQYNAGTEIENTCIVALKKAESSSQTNNSANPELFSIYNIAAGLLIKKIH